MSDHHQPATAELVKGVQEYAIYHHKTDVVSVGDEWRSVHVCVSTTVWSVSITNFSITKRTWWVREMKEYAFITCCVCVCYLHKWPNLAQYYAECSPGFVSYTFPYFGICLSETRDLGVDQVPVVYSRMLSKVKFLIIAISRVFLGYSKAPAAADEQCLNYMWAHYDTRAAQTRDAVC